MCCQIYRVEGILAFWRGNWQNVFQAAGQAALNFALVDYHKSLALSLWLWERGTEMQEGRESTKSQQEQSRPPASWMVSFVAGGLAGGGTAATLLFHTEFLRT